MIDDLINSLHKLKLAEELLERVYMNTDPYKEYPLDKTLHREINNYFEFDDSE